MLIEYSDFMDFQKSKETFEIQRVASIFKSQNFGDSSIKRNRAYSTNKAKTIERKMRAEAL
jgi:hypothetical protein